MSEMEIVRVTVPKMPLKVAIFDFDGTVSLIVEGWQKLLTEMFLEFLRPLPGGELITESYVRKIIDLNTGKRTISQAYSLADEISKLGGTPSPAICYHEEYYRRLDRLTAPRISALKEGKKRDELLVPGIRDCLEMLRSRGIMICLLSGSEQTTITESAKLLGIIEYFGGGIFGTNENPSESFKADTIVKILETNGIKAGEMVGFGDGATETSDVHRLGGLAVGLALMNLKERG